MSVSQLKFGWFHHPMFWMAVVWFGSMFLLGVSLAVTILTPSKSDRVVVIGTCGGLPVLQDQDGQTWLRVNGLRRYRVEDPNKLTCG